MDLGRQRMWSAGRGSVVGGDKECAAPRAGARYVVCCEPCARTVEPMFCAALCETAVSGTREACREQGTKLTVEKVGDFSILRHVLGNTKLR